MTNACVCMNCKYVATRVFAIRGLFKVTYILTVIQSVKFIVFLLQQSFFPNGASTGGRGEVTEFSCNF